MLKSPRIYVSFASVSIEGKFLFRISSYFEKAICTKAVVRRCSVKKVFLETSQACNFIKKETLAHVFSCEFSKISKNTFSYRTHVVAASICKQVQPLLA